MIVPLPGDAYPLHPVNDNRHADHTAAVVAVDLHGDPSWEIGRFCAPTLTIECACGEMWTVDLFEAVQSA